MSGPKRNPDKLNTIGVVVVGICGAVLVYVTIVALQAFYMGDTSEIQTMADYGGQDATHKSIRTTQISNITEFGPNPPDKGAQTYRINIDHAIKLVAADAKQDPANLVPTQGRSTKSTIQPVFGRPKMAAPPGSGPDGAGGAQGSTQSPPASGAQQPTNPTDAAGSSGAQLTPTGGQGPGGGQTAGQGPTPEKMGPQTGAGAGVNPTGAQTPSNTQRNREQGTGTTRRPGGDPQAPGGTGGRPTGTGTAPASKGGNPPTPQPKATGSAASSPTKGNGR